MKQNHFKKTGSKSTDSAQPAENNTGKSTIKHTLLINKSDTGNGVKKGEKMKHNKKKYKHKKPTVVKGSGSGKSAGNITDKNLKQHFNITKETNIEDLKQDLLRESKKNDPHPILILLFDGRNLSIKEIEKLGDFLKQNNIEVTIRPTGDNDFTELAFIIFCNSKHIFFSEETKIYMSSNSTITQVELEEIAKRMSAVMVCDEKELVKYYNQNAIIDPDVIFEEDDEDDESMTVILIDGSYFKTR
jgi:hypothetical protein